MAAVVLVAAGIFAGCGASDGGGASGSGAGDRFAAVHAGVCAASAASARGDAHGAMRAFEDVHTGLHDLAKAAQSRDRAVAGRLLEAKQEVETGGAGRDLTVLVTAVSDAIEVAGGSAPAGCP